MTELRMHHGYDSSGGDTSCLDVVREFPAVATAPRDARRFVCSAASDYVDGETLAEAELLVSELATNALVHAGGPLTVRVHLNGVLRVEITDADPHGVLDPSLPADPMELGHRGLALVDAISRRWGCEPVSRGKRVWFELATRRTG